MVIAAMVASGYVTFSTLGAAPALAPVLTLTPNVAVPGQTVTLNGSGFSSAFIAGGAGPNGVHQITGAGGRVVILGVTLTAPHVTYPINLDSAGNLLANIVIPVNSTNLVEGTRDLSVTDSGGGIGTAKLTIPKRSITLDPATSRRGSTVKLTGTGFPATNPTISGSVTVGIDYGGITVANAVTTSTGAFETTFQVPTGAIIPSTNTVTVTVLGFSATATGVHLVPSASITVNPSSGSAGSQVTVSGTNFPGFTTSSMLSVGIVSVLPLPAPATDRDGSFSASFIVPQLPLGAQVVSAVAGGVSALASFTVEASLVTPTPTPIPPAEPAKALAPLVAADNLLRVWTFDNSTKEWSFFDPRPVFAAANTIKELVTGRVYWINVESNQTSTLNGKERSLFAGWNIVAW
jgi:hypothetical protein